MKRLNAIVLFCVLGSAGKSFALPPCPEDQSQRFHNCFGTFTAAKGDKYVGEWKDNLHHGQGTYTWVNGDKYVGEYKDNLYHGQGTFTMGSGQFKGDKYVGEWKDNLYHGHGTYTFASGSKYVGEWKDDKRWNGIKYSASGEIQGTHSSGKWCGGCKPTAGQLAIVREINEESKPAPKTQPATTTPNLAGTGTGFVINRNYVVTAHHVVDECREVTVTHSHTNYPTRVVAIDSHNDLGLLRLQGSISGTASLRGKSVRLGEKIATYGYPMFGTLSSSASTSEGVVNALAGIGNDTRTVRYDASTQPGNSGGPLLDLSGNVVGVITHRLKKEAGVNFAIKSNIVENFLNSEGISFKKAESTEKLELPDIAEKAERFTVLVGCWE